jgi:hypothetical protein
VDAFVTATETGDLAPLEELLLGVRWSMVGPTDVVQPWRPGGRTRQ